MPRGPHDRKQPGILDKLDTYGDALLGVPFTLVGIVLLFRPSTWREVFDPNSWSSPYFYLGIAMFVVFIVGGISMIRNTLRKLGIIGRRE